MKKVLEYLQRRLEDVEPIEGDKNEEENARDIIKQRLTLIGEERGKKC